MDMVVVWLNIEVIDGPKQINGKIAKLRLQNQAEGDPDLLSSEWHISRTIGRMDLFKMFGDFDGLDKISREHIHIRETDYFPFDRTGFGVYDQRSNNGTTFPDGKEYGMQVLVRLADVITIKLSYCNDDFTIPPTDYIVPIGDRAEMADHELMDLITSEVVKCCKKLGMKWQIRRKWDVREKPVSESELSDYEWKLVPGNREISNRFFEGEYYLLSYDEGGLRFEHSGSFAGVLGPHHSCHHYVVQRGLTWNPEPVHHSTYPFDISAWLQDQIDAFPPNFFSVT